MRRVRRVIWLCLSAGILIHPSPVRAQESGPVYTVQSGDTLSAIARRFGLSQDALVQANNIVDPARLFPGEELLLPGFPGIEGELTLRTIQLGETLAYLSHMYVLDPLDLARLNRMMRVDSAYVGQAVLVPVTEADPLVSHPVRTELIMRGETRLELAAKGSDSPWKTNGAERDPFQLWLLPGKSRLIPGGERTDFFPPLVGDVSVTPNPLNQGKTAVIRLSDTADYRLSGSLGDHTLEFYPDNNGNLVALQGIHALEDPGLLKLAFELRSVEPDEITFAFNQSILVNEGDYGFQFLNGVPPETVDPAYTRPENGLIESVLAPRTETKLWDAAFDLPSRYYTEEFISVFGTRRNYNQGALLYYHTGIDFYGQNIPIYAPADGIVVFADALTVRGNATYLDHGWGVYSGYLHQSEIYVEVGDRVERGQVIGEVGATGRVTGPHLHWEVWVGGVPVEPLEWVTKAIP